MCGLAGLMARDGRPPDPAVVDAMIASLLHRGPDGVGRYAKADVAMAQSRLAIIDLAGGDQPLYGPGGCALMANGEIYNYVELRADLAGLYTNSDCEPPLHLYEKLGESYAEGLRGMYAIALHDPGRGRLLLSRDPFGIKPIYYAEGAQGFAFASEPRAFFAAGLLTAELVPEARDELLQLQFTTGSRTIFRGVHRVLPGETLVLEKGRIVARRRRAALPPGRTAGTDEGTALARLDAVWQDSVRVHQRSDVPYGMFLSGGVDSSAVLAMMARLNDRPVRAYTVGFPSTSVHDERALARRVAKAVGAEHVEVEFGEADFWSLLPKVAAAMDDPAADYATLPTWKLAEVARRDVKVVLSGEGGDELFAGYGRYRSAMRARLLGGRPMRRNGALDGLGLLRRPLEGWRNGYSEAEREAAGGRNKLQAAQALDCADWLPNDLLTKLDRCLMAHGVEGRTPFLDPEVASFALPLPDRLKIDEGQGKYLLRRWLDERLPAAEPFSKKRGFTVPVGEWIGRQGARIGPLVARHPAVAELCEPTAVEALFRRPAGRGAHAAWMLLFYVVWHRAHIERARPEGGIADLLSG